MSQQCILYITDRGYLLPTVLSATQAVKHATADTDVVICLTESVDDAQLIEFCKNQRIRLLDLSQEMKQAFSSIADNSITGKISISALGLLIVHRFLPPEYTSVIYIDGDTQILSSLAELEAMPVPPGVFLAALDYVEITHALHGRSHGSGFNSGMIKFNPRDWIGDQAFDYFVANQSTTYLDQGALNAVNAGNAKLISNRWNYPKQYLHLISSDPPIIHFMAHPKPWDGVYFPCSQRHTAPYEKLLAASPFLRRYKSHVSPARKIIYTFRSIRDLLRYFFNGGESARLKSEMGKILTRYD